MRYRIPDRRPWFASFVSPYLVSSGAVGLDNLLYTPEKGSRWCTDVPDGEAVDSAKVSDVVVIYHQSSVDPSIVLS